MEQLMGIVQTINGMCHSLWSVLSGEYAPSVVTAPVLLVVALCLGLEVHQRPIQGIELSG
jgi:hypothetical protein